MIKSHKPGRRTPRAGRDPNESHYIRTEQDPAKRPG